VAQVEDDFIAAGAQIIWVLTQNQSVEAGTAEDCRAFIESDPRNSMQGWCVGDSETMGSTLGSTSIWHDSPFAIGRGYDAIVSRRDMVIRDVATHGTPIGNENLTGKELLARVQAVIDSL
jgi:hypothetical protein